MEPEILKKILSEHKKFIYSAGKKGIKADLQNADLKGADLYCKRCKLKLCEFKRCKIDQCKLKQFGLARCVIIK
jgi:hypothetical protein